LVRGERLRRTKQFRAIRRIGSWARAGLLSIGALPNDLSTNRLGLRVSRGIKGAVERNRAKRLLREVYRRHKRELVSGYDLLVELHPKDPATISKLEEGFLKTCKRLNLLSSQRAQ